MGSMMKIVLLRHGEPKMNLHTLLKIRLSVCDLEGIVDSYATTSINGNIRPGPESANIANSCNAVVCSSLRRSIESAKELGI